MFADKVASAARRLTGSSKRAWMVLAPLSLLWLLGASRFFLAEPTYDWQAPQSAQHPQEEHNLVAAYYGPRVEASSVFRAPASHHHPLFVVDGRRDPSPIEKWSSDLGDHHPWLKLHWDKPRRVSRVVVWHAGYRESVRFNTRNFFITCLSPHGEEMSWSKRIENNLESITTTQLNCQGAQGVAIDLEPESPTGHARIYEVEVWGQ